MESIIERIFNDTVGNAKLSSKIEFNATLNEKQVQTMEALSKILSPEQNALFDKYVDDELKTYIYACNGYFRYGVEFGVKFILEAIGLSFDKNNSRE